jgi:hypothetical protein
MYKGISNDNKSHFNPLYFHSNKNKRRMNRERRSRHNRAANVHQGVQKAVEATVRAFQRNHERRTA